MSHVRCANAHTVSLVAAAASWGTATAISKRAVDEIQPLTLLPIELAVSVAVLTFAVVITREPFRWSSEHRRLGLLGVLNPGISYALSLAGLARITASTSVLLWATEPLLILGLAYLILKDRVTLASGIGAATALTGVALVVFQPGAQADATGIALTVAGVGACALYTVLSSKVLADASSLSIVLLQQAAALIFALALLAGSFVLGDPSAVSQVSAIGWLSAAAAGVLYYAVAFWFYVNGLRGVRPAFAGMFINLIPVFGLTASYLVLGERLARRQWLGVSLVLAAVIAIARFQVSQGQVATRPAPTSPSPTD